MGRRRKGCRKVKGKYRYNGRYSKQNICHKFISLTALDTDYALQNETSFMYDDYLFLTRCTDFK
jgi:hypothetical protein